MATKTMAGLKPLRFFKVFIAQRSSQKLEIPRAYVGLLKVRRHKYVNLMGPSGVPLAVLLASRDGRLYLDQGWMEFVKCNSLRDRDFLVFKYDGEVKFKVKVLDFSTRMSRSAFDAKGGQGLSNSEVEGNGAESSARGHLNQVNAERRDACSVPTFAIHMKDYNLSSSPVVRIPAWVVKEHFSNYGAKIKIVLQNTEGKKEWPVNFSVKSRCMFRGWSQFFLDNHIKTGDTCVFQVVQKFKMIVHISQLRTPSQSSQLKRPANLAKLEEFDAKKKFVVSEHGNVYACPIYSGLLNSHINQAHVFDGAQNVAQTLSRGHTKLKAEEQSVAEPAAKEFPSRTVPVRKFNVHNARTVEEEDEITRRVQAATKRAVEELQEQKEKTDSKIAQLREENKKIMQMLQGLKNFGRDTSH